jgi:hypothetical protein
MVHETYQPRRLLTDRNFKIAYRALFARALGGPDAEGVLVIIQRDGETRMGGGICPRGDEDLTAKEIAVQLMATARIEKSLVKSAKDADEVADSIFDKKPWDAPWLRALVETYAPEATVERCLASGDLLVSSVRYDTMPGSGGKRRKLSLVKRITCEEVEDRRRDAIIEKLRAL